MKRINRILLAFGISIISFASPAQTQKSLPVPVDPEIRYGKLDNGMTYYIRHNEEPASRASFYIIQNVGSLLENDDQNGLAHFLEHMAFNGTKHFPGKGIISSLEKHGVAFGYNINAYTYYYETVYNLSDVPVDAPGLLDTCLLILNDWSDYILLSEEEIDAERGVIQEEWRTHRTADFRIMEKTLPVLLKGSKYPERDIIGDINIIQNFEPSTLRDFYHSWYRTDLQAIAIVGDFDAEQMEMKVKELFSKIAPVANPPEVGTFPIPWHKEPYYVLATDPEASQSSVDLYIIREAWPSDSKGTDYLREQYVRTLFNSMMSRRINELLQKGIPPFTTGSITYGSFFRGYDIFSLGASARKNEEAKAFEAILTEAERVKRYGFTAGELERAKSTMLTNWESYYKQRDKIDNDTYARNIQQNFLENEPLPSVEFEYQAVREMVPGITLEEVSRRAREWMSDENRVVVVQGPEGEGTIHLTEAEAFGIIEKVAGSEIEPYVDQAGGQSLINEPLPGGKIVATKEIEGFGASEWTLSNGVRVVFRKADYEKDNVSLMGYSPGGSSLVDDEYIPEAEMISIFSSAYGAGEFDNITLQKMLSGKKASLSVSLGEVTENISGSSTPGDIEIMFQLLYLKFEKPRFDLEAHDALMARFNAMLETLNNNPQKVIQDSMILIMSDHNPRARVQDNAYLEDVEFDRLREIYRSRFRDADDFTFFIVGNIEEEAVKTLVEKYIGSLTSFPGSEKWIDRNVRMPDGVTTRNIEMPLAVPKATVIVSFSGALPYNPYNRQAARVLNGILDLMYNETIREEEGGTYTISTTVSAEQYPKEKSNSLIAFECDPARAEELKKIIYDQIDILVNEGPDQEKLDKAVANILKTREESKQHNSYWMSALYTLYFSGIDYNDPSNYEDILKGFTREDIRKEAALFFRGTDIVDIIFEPSRD